MISTQKLPIGQILLEEGLLTQEKLDQAIAEQQHTGQYLGELLVARGFVTAESLVKTLAKRLAIRGCQLQTGMADPAVLALIGEEEALRLKALPMFKVRDMLTVAMAEPQSLPQIDRLRQLTNCNIRPVLALEANIVEFIKRHAGMKVDLESFRTSARAKDAPAAGVDENPVIELEKLRENGTVVNLVNMVLLKSIRDRASDVHIEPNDASTRIRYRVDGVLQDLLQPADEMHSSIVSRIKVLAHMDIAEKRLPQEGRVSVLAEGRRIDLRVSTMPTLLGEKVVIRILDKANLKVSLDDLGFSAEALAIFKRILRRPYGMMLVTGPTGSGKTTTLYSALDSLRSPKVNVVTVEDPVEYQLDLINQIQVQADAGRHLQLPLRRVAAGSRRFGRPGREHQRGLPQVEPHQRLGERDPVHGRAERGGRPAASGTGRVYGRRERHDSGIPHEHHRAGHAGDDGRRGRFCGDKHLPAVVRRDGIGRRETLMFLTSTRTPIGLDIGRRFIKAAQLRGNELLAAACIRRTGGDCMPGPGEIRPLADALRARPFQGRAVVVAMPHDKLLTSIVELPPRASGAPIEQLARSELARIHHKNAHGLEMAHWELPVSANASSRTMVMVTACVRDDADGLLDALEAEGLEVLTLAFPAAAALCACQALIEAEESGAVLDVGWQASRLILQHKGLIVYERSLEKCGLSATKTTTCVYGPYIRTVPALPVGAAKGNTGIATATGTGVGWIYDGAGNISTNTTGTEADSFGKLYSAY